ncbi:MAG: FtsW/RodA/SpoVE family cell cycle protein, partial [Planctomycetes bacterium]|nr:FtsW/RodA/SpoVE family cell cycle protein [Planctomycetota bacterium]
MSATATAPFVSRVRDRARGVFAKAAGPPPPATVRYDSLHLVAIVLTLTGIGLIMVFSTTAVADGSGLVDGVMQLKRQATWVLVSVLSLLVTARIDYHVLGRLGRYALAAAAIALLLVLIPHIGARINGARRWFLVARLSIQPSEIAKVALAVGLADLLVRKHDILGDFKKGYVPVMALIGFFVGVIAIEPDIGTAVLVLCVTLTMAIVAGIRFRHLVPTLLLMMPPAMLALFLKFEHIGNRLSGFRNPLESYHTLHSLVALGSGGVFGVGLGNGREKLNFLPAKSTDFIFSILGEELGFVGTAVVVLLFAAFIVVGLRIALRAPDRLGFLIALGLT